MAGLLSFRRKIRTGYVFSFLLMVISFFLIFYLQHRLAGEARWVAHSYTVKSNAEALGSEVTNAETAIRGYVLTQDLNFLKPYNDAIVRIPGLIKELKDLTVDNQVQNNRFDTLGKLVDKRMLLLAQGLRDFQANGFRITDQMRLRRPSTLNAMDSLRLFVLKTKNAEQELMDSRQSRLSQLFSRIKLMAGIALAIVVLILLYSVVTFTIENNAREKSDKRANKYRIDLESNKNELKEKDIELKELKDLEKFTSTGRIARTIAHEVRNPLTNILLATEQLQEADTRSEESPVLLALINRNVSRINQLVSDLLNATRFSHLDFAKVSINELIEESLEMAKDRLDLNHISVEKNYNEEICDVYVDKEKMKMALLNIIVNAVEAMEKETGVLQIKTRKQGKKCIIEIKDNGKGMEEEELQKMFEPYFTSKPKGNGLGLTNTQNIILNHKGKITAYSKAGKGTLILVALNVFEENQSASSTT